MQWAFWLSCILQRPVANTLSLELLKLLAYGQKRLEADEAVSFWLNLGIWGSLRVLRVV